MNTQNYSNRWASISSIIKMCRSEKQRVSVKMKLLLLTSLLIRYSICHEHINITSIEPIRNDYPLQKIWIANSVVGVFGVILNSFVLLTFFQDRNELVTSVNAMIM